MKKIFTILALVIMVSKSMAIDYPSNTVECCKYAYTVQWDLGDLPEDFSEYFEVDQASDGKQSITKWDVAKMGGHTKLTATQCQTGSTLAHTWWLTYSKEQDADKYFDDKKLKALAKDINRVFELIGTTGRITRVSFINEYKQLSEE